jgi:hypothetical protein
LCGPGRVVVCEPLQGQHPLAQRSRREQFG